MTDRTETTSCGHCETIRAAQAAYVADHGITELPWTATTPPWRADAMRRDPDMAACPCRCHVPARIVGVVWDGSTL